MSAQNNENNEIPFYHSGRIFASPWPAWARSEAPFRLQTNKRPIQRRVSGAFDEPRPSPAAPSRVCVCVSPQVLTALSYRRLAEPRAAQRLHSSDSGG